MISFEQLNEAFEQVTKQVSKEKDFQIGDNLVVTLRSLPAEVEVEIQKEAKSALEEGDENDPATFADYVDRMRVGTASRALIGINGTYFRDDRVGTGDFIQTPDGGRKEVTEDRHVALRRIIRKWPRNIHITLYECYDQVMTEIDDEISKHVKFDPVKVDQEITRLEHRLKELKERKEKIEKGRQPDFVESHRKKIVERGEVEKQADRDDMTRAIYEGTQEANKRTQAREEGEQKKTAPPPRRRRQQGQPQQPSQGQEASQGRADPYKTDPPRDDSMIDWDNPQASIRAEQQRVMRERQERMRVQEQALKEAREKALSRAGGGEPQTVSHDLSRKQPQPMPVQRRQPSAAQVAERAHAANGMTEKAAFEEQGEIGGKPAYAFNKPAEIDLSGRPPQEQGQPEVNKSAEEQSVNRNFVPPNRRR